MGKALRCEHFQNKGPWTCPVAPHLGTLPPIGVFTLHTKCAQFVPKSDQLGLTQERCHPPSFSRPLLGPGGLKTSGGGEGRGCLLLPWLREIRVSSACWKLGFHEGLHHWLSFAISGAAIAILVQGKRDFQALNVTGGAFSNLRVGRVWI
jgi:hypothetical protein